MTRLHLLAWLGGAQRKILRDTPGDAARYSSMGAVLIGTAAVAALSATFALNTAVKLPMAGAAVVGALWGLLILSLDRMLVISMSTRSGFLSKLGSALPRLFLALLIGAVISVPLVLRIFEPEINSELQLMHAESVIEKQKKLDEQYADIPGRQAKVDELQPIANGGIPPSVSGDPDVKAATAAVTTAQKAYDNAAKRAQCELDGSCGSRQPGHGPAWQAAQARADEAQRTLDAAKRKLAQVERATAARISGGAAAAQQAARQELELLQPQLRQQIADRDAAQRRLESSERENTGLLARIEALDRLSSGRPLMLVAHWALILLFACIELLPVIAKLLSGSGRPSLYDQLVKRREDDVLAADQIWSDAQQERVDLDVGARREIDRHRAAIQVEGAKAANAKLAAKQQEIAERAIEVWAQVAMERTDDDLARWYAQHSRAAQPPPPVIPTSPLSHPTGSNGWAAPTTPPAAPAGP